MYLKCTFLLNLAAAATARDDPTRARRVAALVGGFAADAAAMPLHWIYDTDAIATILTAANRTASPEFLVPSHAPYYDYPPGEFSPFGEQMLVYARELAASSSVEPQAIADAYEVMWYS